MLAYENYHSLASPAPLWGVVSRLGLPGGWALGTKIR